MTDEATTEDSKARRSVLVVVASRAEYTRYFSVLKAIDERDDLDLVLVAAGQVPLRRHGLALDVLRADGFEPREVIYQTIEGENSITMGRTVGLTIIDYVGLLARQRPDWVLVMGDRFEALALTTAAAMAGLRIAHIQGGELSGSIDEPIRHSITKFSHIHFASTERAGEVIRRMGEAPETVFVTGCPSVDLLSQIEPEGRQRAYELLTPAVKLPLTLQEELPLILVVYHPTTTREAEQGDDVRELMAALESVEATRAIFWPNIDAGADRILDVYWQFQQRHMGEDTVLYLNNFPPKTFLRILANADLLLGNSSSGIREACYFGTPVVNIGDRQAGRLRTSNVLDVDVDREAIRSGIERQLATGRFPVERTYGERGAGVTIAALLAERPLPPIQKSLHYPDLLQAPEGRPARAESL